VGAAVVEAVAVRILAAPIAEEAPMATSDAPTVQEYMDSLPPDRREAIEAVRKVVLTHLPKGFEETMQYGMISYVIPLERYPDTYNGQALAVASLASQKNYMSLYLLGIYGREEEARWFEEAYRATGKRLDMGKSCVRFRGLDALPLDVVGEAIARTSVEEFIAAYEAARAGTKPAKAKKS
jgi:hypothetical protein